MCLLNSCKMTLALSYMRLPHLVYFLLVETHSAWLRFISIMRHCSHLLVQCYLLLSFVRCQSIQICNALQLHVADTEGLYLDKIVLHRDNVPFHQ